MPRYTVDTDLRPAMRAQGFTCCVLDTETEGLKSITTAKAYCFFQEDAERIAAALNAAEEREQPRAPWPFPAKEENPTYTQR